MILFDLNNTENEPAYQKLRLSNLDRQYDFFASIVETSFETRRTYVSQTVLKAFNYHAIVCLHSGAGEFRKHEVQVGNHTPPQWMYVQALMDDFVNQINFALSDTDPITMAAWALWRLNWIHPFVNGNGRTARLIAYYIICLRSGGLLPGSPTLPELLRRKRGEADDPYVAGLRHADASLQTGTLDLEPLQLLVRNLLEEQLSSISEGEA